MDADLKIFQCNAGKRQDQRKIVARLPRKRQRPIERRPRREKPRATLVLAARNERTGETSRVRQCDSLAEGRGRPQTRQQAHPYAANVVGKPWG